MFLGCIGLAVLVIERGCGAAATRRYSHRSSGGLRSAEHTSTDLRSARAGRAQDGRDRTWNEKRTGSGFFGAAEAAAERILPVIAWADSAPRLRASCSRLGERGSALDAKVCTSAALGRTLVNGAPIGFGFPAVVSAATGLPACRAAGEESSRGPMRGRGRRGLREGSCRAASRRTPSSLRPACTGAQASASYAAAGASEQPPPPSPAKSSRPCRRPPPLRAAGGRAGSGASVPSQNGSAVPRVERSWRGA